MQTSISAEEFACFQSQLIELRQQKYSAKEDLFRAEKKIASLEDALAHQSGELAQLRSRLSCIQNAGDIETVANENHSLRQRLLNVESSFQLQSSTLRAECERLQAENSRLKESHNISNVNDAVVQTPTSFIISTVSVSSQTFNSGWASAITQTKATSAEVGEWFSKAKESTELSQLLETERKTSEELLKDVNRLEFDVERLEGECESLRSELSVAERRGERIQRELQRQLASAVRAVKHATSTNAPSLSSLVVVPTSDQTLDGISVESFSLCSGSQTAVNENGESWESSSGSQAQQSQQPVFSEEDLKGLLSRLSEVQEDNCNLRHRLKYLQQEVDSKSKVIQRTLADKFNSTSLSNHVNAKESCRNATGLSSFTSPPTAAAGGNGTVSTNASLTPIRLASDLISTLRGRLKNLETSSPAFALNSTELKGLKVLCEELMTRNVSLENALEAAIAGSNGNLED